jgi:hypothetical protein
MVVSALVSLHERGVQGTFATLSMASPAFIASHPPEMNEISKISFSHVLQS